MTSASQKASGRTSSRLLYGLAIGLVVVLACGAQSLAQTRGGGVPYQPGWSQDPLQPNYPVDSASQIMEQKRLNALNKERQKQLVTDTDRLVQLSAELNAEINNAHQSELTPEQLRKVAEIEKLAHNIREKMTMPLQGITSPTTQPATVVFPPGMK